MLVQPHQGRLLMEDRDLQTQATKSFSSFQADIASTDNGHSSDGESFDLSTDLADIFDRPELPYARLACL